MSGSRGRVITPSITINLNSSISQITEMSSNDIRQLIQAIQERDDRNELLSNIVQGIGSENQPGTYGDLEGTHGEELAIRQHQLDIMQQQITDQNAIDIIGLGVSQAQARTIALYKNIADAKENPSSNNLSVLRDALINAYNLPKALEILNKISPTPSNSVFYAPPGDPASRGLGSPDPNYGRLTEPARGYTPGEPIAPSNPALQNNNSNSIYTPPELSSQPSDPARYEPPATGVQMPAAPETTPSESISPSIYNAPLQTYSMPKETTLVGNPEVEDPSKKYTELGIMDPASRAEAAAQAEAAAATEASHQQVQEQQLTQQEEEALYGVPPEPGTTTEEPVILDLTGNGIKIAQKSQSSMFFDMAGDGYQHHTAWAGAGNGVLVLDIGNTGKITQQNQVVFTQWDPTAQNDMQALRDVFDTNHNGKLDAGDAHYADFKILVTNADGTTMLKTLAQAA